MSSGKSPTVEPEPLVPMARVSRAAAAHRRGRSSTGDTHEAVDLYPSINSLRSIQAKEDVRNYRELFVSGESTLFTLQKVATRAKIF